MSFHLSVEASLNFEEAANQLYRSDKHPLIGFHHCDSRHHAIIEPSRCPRKSRVPRIFGYSSLGGIQGESIRSWPQHPPIKHLGGGQFKTEEQRKAAASGRGGAMPLEHIIKLSGNIEKMAKKKFHDTLRKSTDLHVIQLYLSSCQIPNSLLLKTPTLNYH